MDNPYRTYGVRWQPRTKRELIDWLIKSGRWNDTKSKLLAMERDQIKVIYNRIRVQLDIEFKARTPVHLYNGQASKNIPQTQTQNEVKHDRTNNATGGIERADGSR